MSVPGKEKEKEKLLQSKVIDIIEGLGYNADDKYVDLNVTCIRKDD